MYKRQITVEAGTNVLLGLDPARIAELPALLEEAGPAPGEPPPFWDGHAAPRAAAAIASRVG